MLIDAVIQLHHDAQTLVRVAIHDHRRLMLLVERLGHKRNVARRRRRRSDIVATGPNRKRGRDVRHDLLPQRMINVDFGRRARCQIGVVDRIRVRQQLPRGRLTLFALLAQVIVVDPDIDVLFAELGLHKVTKVHPDQGVLQDLPELGPVRVRVQLAAAVQRCGCDEVGCFVGRTVTAENDARGPGRRRGLGIRPTPLLRFFGRR